MAYVYGSSVSVISAWSAYLRTGVQVTLTSETSTACTYTYTFVGQGYNYHGMPHHYFNATVNGNQVLNQSDIYSGGTYPGNETWYTENSYSSTVTIQKTTSAQTITFSGAFGTLYGYTPSGQSIWVSKADSSVSTTVTVPALQGIVHTKVSGSWKNGDVYVKVNGSWKQGILYTKVSSNWKQGI